MPTNHSKSSSRGVDERDLRVIEEQLGRRPRGVLAVERRCPAGHPQVIKVYPLLGEEPFPTLFWLTCPEIVRQISRLEHEGWIERLEELIQSDPELRRRYHESHRAYLRERWETLLEPDRRWIEEHGLLEVFQKRGIGGLRDWDRVKCLHMHYAHHKARGNNPIGEWIEEHFEIRECGMS
jgi:hypothetical protein